MKRIIQLLLISIISITLVACTNETREITFNIEDNSVFTQYVEDASFDITSVTAIDSDGMNLSPFIEIIGDYDLNTVGSYNLELTVSDNYGTTKTVPIVLEVLEKTCEMDNTQDKCKIGVTAISLTNAMAFINLVYVDDFVKLQWEITPEDASNQEVIITTSDETIATVSEYGHVFGVSPGTVTITIRTVDGSFEVTKSIQVMEKSCTMDPYQEKCAADVLSDTSRIVTLGDSNVSGTDYSTVYVNNRIYYEIFVRTFADSDNNGVGDIQGIIDNLPYLKSLGVGGIWLMPVTESRTDHGYEVDDYLDIERDYGDIDDFKELVTVAAALDIHIIMDLVVNHMGAFNPKFQDVLKNGVNSDYYDWFTWLNEGDPRIDIRNSWGGEMWYNPSNRNWLRDGYYNIHDSLDDKYYCGYFSDWMPDLNLKNPEVVQYIYDVSEWWIAETGLQGFRMDATSHFFGYNEHGDITDRDAANTNFLTDYMNNLKTVKPDVYVVLEAWEGYHTYAKFAASDASVFNFQASYDIKDAARGYLSEDIGTRFNRVYNEISKYNNDFIDAVFFNNHDTERLAYNTSDPIKLRLAAEILLTLPGNPYIYYGDELGMRGQRTNMVWGSYYTGLNKSYDDRNVTTVNAQLLDDDSLLSSYQELGSIRNESLALSYGDFIPYDNGQVEGYYRVFENGDDKELVVVLFNFSNVYHKIIPEEFTTYEIMYSSYDTDFGGISPNGVMILRLPYNLKDTLIN